MTLNSYIVDPVKKQKARVVDGTEPSALVVATRPLKTFSSGSFPFINETYGVEMAQDAGFGGTPDKIHDGLDSVLWTGSAVSGVKFTFDSADQNHTPAGSQSVKVDGAAVGNVMQFAKGSDVTITSYVGFSLWIYVDLAWEPGDDIQMYAWDTGTGTMVGNAISLQNYFDFAEFNVWQKLAIPFADMGLVSGTFDAVRIEVVAKAGTQPVWYLDDFQVEETGAAIEYIAEPPACARSAVGHFQIL